MNAEQSTQNHKDFARHEKLFKVGMKAFESGLSEPDNERSPEYYGWKAAQEMAEVKRKWLETSRCNCGVDDDAQPQSQSKPKTKTTKEAARDCLKGIDLDAEKAHQAFQIIELFLLCGVKVKKGANQKDIKQWILTDTEGNKAGLYLGSGFGWSLDGLKVDQELTGFFDMDFDCWLSDNDIDVD